MLRVRSVALFIAMCIAPCIVGAQQSAASGEPQSSNEIPSHSVLQNRPCAEQSKSLRELQQSFRRGKTPSPTDMTGSWVAIGIFGDSYRGINCTGVKRGPKLEEVMLAKGYSLEMHLVGTYDQSRTMKRKADGSVTFPFDFGGDASPVYRCRMTARQSLACLIDVYRQGVEYKRMPVQQNEIFSQKSGG